jgi:flavin-binding protein dodecin
VSGAWPWAAVAALGAYHGIDPSMGWLFAVALGLQERSRAKVLWSLLPIAIGHLASIAAVVAIIGGLRFLVAIEFLRPLGAAILIGFGIFRFIWPRAHPRWVAMRVNPAELALWSFIMASAHGAGLMLFPILVGMTPHSAHAAHQMAAARAAHTMWQAVGVVIVHTGAMVIVMGAIAIVVYDYVGLAILRSAWINLDTIWAGALIAAGVLSIIV